MSASTDPSLVSCSRLLEADVSLEAARAGLAASGAEAGIVVREGRIAGVAHLADLVPAPWPGGDEAPLGERLAPPGSVLWIG